MKKYFMRQEVCDRKQKAFSTLIIVVIAGAVGLAVVLTLALLSVSSGRITRDFYSSQKVKSLANACAMQGLIIVRNDKNFSGSGTITIDGLTCNYLVIDTGGLNREIRAWSEISDVIRKVKILTTITYPQMSTSFWEEVADF